MKKPIFIASTVVILALIIAGIAIVGSPKTARLMAYDQQRRYDIENIYNQVNFGDYASGSQITSSAEIEERLKEALSNYKDPQTGKEYGYRLIDNDTYEICANFNFAYPENDKPGYSRPYYDYNTIKHKAGSQCIERTVEFAK